MNRAQLNAISRNYTMKAQKKARQELQEKYNINFDKFAKVMNYKGSPVRLLTGLQKQELAAIKRAAEYLIKEN